MTSETIRPKNWSMILSFLGVKGAAWLTALIYTHSGSINAFSGNTGTSAMLIGLVGVLGGLLAGKGTQAGSIGGKTKEKRNAKKARQEWVDNQIEREKQQ